MSTIAVGECAGTLRNVHELSLIQEDYLQRLPQGSTLTVQGHAPAELKSANGGE
jgi:hypothetical protein